MPGISSGMLLSVRMISVGSRDVGSGLDLSGDGGGDGVGVGVGEGGGEA